MNWSLIILILTSMVSIIGCSAMAGGGSPTEVIKTFVTGLKEKDPEKVKSVLTENSLKMLEMGAKASDMSVDEFVKSGKASEGLKVDGDYRNEKTEGETATVEAKSGEKWETIHLIKENGAWKVALDKG